MRAKALLIDPIRRTVSPVVINSYEQLRELIGGSFAMGHYWPNGDTLYVDDAGLLKPGNLRFRVPGGHQELAGRGVVCGPERSNDDGDFECQLDVLQDPRTLEQQIAWIDPVPFPLPGAANINPPFQRRR